MTGTLPENANIEWLKKSAKQLLREWRAQGRDARLADAQFQLARSYGFTSWRAMRQAIDRLRDQGHEGAEGSESNAADRFLKQVGSGDMTAIKAALRLRPGLVNAVGAHPFWGGRPQPLHVAVETKRLAVFEYLLDAGADPAGINAGYDNWSPLMLALSRRLDAMSKILVDKGAPVGVCEALLMADDARLEQCLAQGPAVLEQNVPSGSLLSLARTEAAIARLMELNVSPDTRDRWGADAMEALSRLGKRGRVLVRAMARYGKEIKPEELARLGDRDALVALSRSEPDAAWSDAALVAAVDFGHHEIVEWMLANGANPNAQATFGARRAALHSAAWNGDLQIVKILVRAGADTSALDEEHQNTPLGWSRVARQVTNNPDCEEVEAYLTGLEKI
ncbi:ankyrin repeat domain-containing protein [Nitratireductor sp. XY-223]|uniref:ankyrin repeat domain-containing protein n=1 Tax=Nitratireductor sp. XY-223 TaxID=2561926 RepID=UPI0010AB4B4B|nr:ankyrin repeat domain-containing protein [Nitratireductor sp. XY-223]